MEEEEQEIWAAARDPFIISPSLDPTFPLLGSPTLLLVPSLQKPFSWRTLWALSSLPSFPKLIVPRLVENLLSKNVKTYKKVKT